METQGGLTRIAEVLVGRVPDEAGAGHALAGLRVLVVDDGDADRALTAETLAGAGAVVSQGCDGEDALLLATTQPYDAIVLDIEMPRVDGFEVTRRLRILGVETPIYALTSLRISPDDPRRKNFNVSGWFEKPLKGTVLVRALSLPGRYAIRPQVNPDLDHDPRLAAAFDVTQLASASPRILAVVYRFSEELQSMVEAIAAAAGGNDTDSLKAQLHRLRGAAGSCGFSTLMTAVERWEDALDAGHGDSLLLLEGLRQAADDGRTAFLRFYEERGSTPLNV